MLQFCNFFFFGGGGGGGGHVTRPPSGTLHVAPYLLLDGHSHNPRLNLDSLHVKNEFYYQSNESIKLFSPKTSNQKSNAAPF